MGSLAMGNAVLLLLLLLLWHSAEAFTSCCGVQHFRRSRHRTHIRVVYAPTPTPIPTPDASVINSTGSYVPVAVPVPLPCNSSWDTRTLTEYGKLSNPRGVQWDTLNHAFKPVEEGSFSAYEAMDGLTSSLKKFLVRCFLPQNVTPDYYSYTKWRILQRFVSATVNVFGTQALLLALGIKSHRLGAAATISWVLKDALGKFGRIFWASKNGRRFDSDAKKWRFRSSLLFATGNGLEIITYVFPASFLLLATSANALKQMSMLTSSATRNAMYRSFARQADNIGDITAKGEAQIAVVDLFGMMAGILLSKAIGTARLNLVVAYLLLSFLDTFAIYNEIRSVVFNSLNYERLRIVLSDWIKTRSLANSTPKLVAKRERIFWPTLHGEDLFTTWSQCKASPEVLRRCADKFISANEKFIVTCKVEDTGLLGSLVSRVAPETFHRSQNACSHKSRPALTPQILLHKDASPFDVFRSLVAVNLLIHSFKYDEPTTCTDYSSDTLVNMVARAYNSEKAAQKQLTSQLRAQGWDLSRFMFGTIETRVQW